MKALRHKSSGNDRSWQFDRRPMDASLRLMTHGKVLPLEEHGVAREAAIIAALSCFAFAAIVVAVWSLS